MVLEDQSKQRVCELVSLCAADKMLAMQIRGVETIFRVCKGMIGCDRVVWCDVEHLSTADVPIAAVIKGGNHLGVHDGAV